MTFKPISNDSWNLASLIRYAASPRTSGGLSSTYSLKTAQQEVVFLSKQAKDNPLVLDAGNTSGTDSLTAKTDLLQTALKQISAFSQQLQAQGKQTASAISESKQQAARQHLAMLKQRIDQLKKMLVWLNPQTAKGILAQIKELAKELQQTAKDLSGSSGSSSGNSNVSVQTPDAPATAATGSADTTASSEAASAAQASAASAASASRPTIQVSSNPDSKAAQEDAKALQEVSNKLKQLFAMVKSQLKRDKPNDDAVKDIDKLFKETDDISKSILADHPDTLVLTVGNTPTPTGNLGT
ncbi:hypothetical protein [Leeia oryzae]|uniref:hypothetical protein n=1 Tax=Leeia oryzae TaxID=356662 RepID=UPI00036C1438|nr:hypothetical protein [Leeia oryzae]